ncbi:hypothetical protein FQA39_LY11371 [Lamprigera yunnana]|nr:hypothetical protein FQA39_LY11371 [Lamprigera yunnana]
MKIFLFRKPEPSTADSNGIEKSILVPGPFQKGRFTNKNFNIKCHSNLPKGLYTSQKKKILNSIDKKLKTTERRIENRLLSKDVLTENNDIYHNYLVTKDKPCIIKLMQYKTARNKAKNCAQKVRRQVFDEDVHKNAKRKRPIKKIEESSEEEISESIKSHDSLSSDEDPQQFFERLRQEAEIEETVDEDEQPIKEEFVLVKLATKKNTAALCSKK